jgi:hypothetical protein
MLFFFKEKKVVVDAFCSEETAHAYDYAPIDYADQFYPEWWKKLGKTEFDFTQLERKIETMKLCAGFLDHYSRGLIIPMWSELAIKTFNGLYSYQYSDRTSKADHHANEQRKGFYDDHINIKLISPWLLRSEKNVSFTFLPAFWNNAKAPDYQVATGTTNFYYQFGTHINLLIKDHKEFIIPFNHPMVHLMPLTERKVELRRHLISPAEFERERHKMKEISFVGAYHKLKKHRELMEEKQASKCPFHRFMK